MIPLTNRSSATTQKLVITLGGSAATTYPTCTVGSYIVPPQSKPDFAEYRSAPQFTLLTAATETTIADAPPEGSVKNINYVCVPNPDTATVTATIAIDDNGTNRNQTPPVVLAVGDTLYYDNKRGWYVMTASGAIKLNSGISSVSSSTDNAFVRWDGASGTLVQNSSATLDDNGRPTFPTTIGVGNATPSTSGSGVSFPAAQSASTDANTLDDYEEGTWTPGQGSLTVVGAFSSSGTYVKIGKAVFFNGNVAGATSIAAVTNDTITDLPFAPALGTFNGTARSGDNTKTASLQIFTDSKLYFAGAVTATASIAVQGFYWI